MNIFVVQEDPVRAARDLCDVHVNKMLSESCQMLCTALHTAGAYAPWQPSYVNHPCNVWCRTSAGNWEWLYQHARALAYEFALRYGHEHACRDVLDVIWLGRNEIRRGPQTPFVQAVPPEFRGPDAVLAYRSFYIFDKAPFARWTHGRPPPSWWPVVRSGDEHAQHEHLPDADLGGGERRRPLQLLEDGG